MSPNDLSTLPTTDLEHELARRRKRTALLERRREALLKELAAIDAELGAVPSPRSPRRSGRPAGSPSRTLGATSGRRAPRARNATTLTEALATLLKDRTMTVSEAMAAVREAGYKSEAASFRIMVNSSLLKGPFRKVGRGTYTAS